MANSLPFLLETRCPHALQCRPAFSQTRIWACVWFKSTRRVLVKHLISCLKIIQRMSRDIYSYYFPLAREHLHGAPGLAVGYSRLGELHCSVVSEDGHLSSVLALLIASAELGCSLQKSAVSHFLEVLSTVVSKTVKSTASVRFQACVCWLCAGRCAW